MGGKMCNIIKNAWVNRWMCNKIKKKWVNKWTNSTILVNSLFFSKVKFYLDLLNLGPLKMGQNPLEQSYINKVEL
jgi:hypothetical protein